MKLSRRELSLLLPALAAAQNSGGGEVLPSAAFRWEQLTARKTGPMTGWQILNGKTHGGFRIDLHESELPAGESPHPPHSHVHEELLLMREGTLDVTIKGQVTRLGPGSAAYLASKQEHGWHNPGPGPARYFVLALGEEPA